MVVDIAFTLIGLNYFTTVTPRFEEFNKGFVESRKVKSLREFSQADIN